MKNWLRHSHIAVKANLIDLAKTANARPERGVDDLGSYLYFDLTVSNEDGAEQLVRFAAHDGDRMVHLLAQQVDSISDIAQALSFVGIETIEKLAVSTDQNGVALRDARFLQEVWDRQQKPSIGSRQFRHKYKLSRGFAPQKPRGLPGRILSKIERMKEGGRVELTEVPLRALILPQFVGHTFIVRVGKKSLVMKVREDMIGHQFREFATLHRVDTQGDVRVKPTSRSRYGRKAG